MGSGRDLFPETPSETCMGVYRVGQGFVSRNAIRNMHGRVQGEVLLVPLISCSNKSTRGVPPLLSLRTRLAKTGSD